LAELNLLVSMQKCRPALQQGTLIALGQDEVEAHHIMQALLPVL
jgi:hypothetical protein